MEHVTVISGTLQLGMGEKFDQSAGRIAYRSFVI
jgi:hypothetical protein